MSQFMLPDLGEGLEEAQLVEWLVKVGDEVHLNQPICQVETAKALVDIPSPFAGTVEALHAKPGDTVPVGAPLITIASEDAQAGGTETKEDGRGPVLVGYGTEGPAQAFARRRRAAPSPVSAAGEGETRASPLVRKVATERGIDLSTIRGTGPGGRIRMEDLESAPAAAPATAPVATATARADVAEDEERISTVGLRKAIAARMVKAATTIPHFTEYAQFDASPLVALRERLRNEERFASAHLTFLPFFVRAVVEAVRAYPILNSRWDEEGNAIVIKRSVHVGIATDTPRGLLVPVVRNAHTLNLATIATECERLIRMAREGTISAADLTGSTITITNVGAAGPVDTGAPLINPPEACVVGLGAIKPRATVVGDRVEVRPGAWISASCDHRIVDGAVASQFMGELMHLLETPEELV